VNKKTLIIDDRTKFKKTKLVVGRPIVKLPAGPVHATIYAAGSPTFQRYAVEWVRRMKLRFPKDRVENPISVASLEAFLDFLESHSNNTFLSIAFFGHGYPGGFIFEGTQGHYTNTLDVSFLSDTPESLVPKSENSAKALNSLMRRPISGKKSEFKGSTIYVFACHSFEESRLRSEDGNYITMPSIASALASNFSASIYAVDETMYYLPVGFGFATKNVESRSSDFFHHFNWILEIREG
jgi:hypothetical protein